MIVSFELPDLPAGCDDHEVVFNATASGFPEDRNFQMFLLNGSPVWLSVIAKRCSILARPKPKPKESPSS